MVVLAVTGTGMASLAGRHSCKGLEKVRGKVMCVGKVLEEDGENQLGVHALDKGAPGVAPPMLKNRDAGASEETQDGPEVSELVCL